jgi:hypothetical protein
VKTLAAGPAAAAAVGTEAHWEEGFVLRRRPARPAEVECPEFFAGCAEELLAAGKSVQLLRHDRRGGWSQDEDEDRDWEGGGGTWGGHGHRLKNGSSGRSRGGGGGSRRSGSSRGGGGSSGGGGGLGSGGSKGEEGDGDDEEEDAAAAAAAVPEMGHHLCVDFCESVRAAIEAAAAAPAAAAIAVEAGEGENAGRYEDDEGLRLLSGLSLEPCPSRPDGTTATATATAFATAASAASTTTSVSAAREETSALIAAGLAGSSTHVAPFVGERLEWGGVPFERPPALAAAAALDAWLASVGLYSC